MLGQVFLPSLKLELHIHNLVCATGLALKVGVAHSLIPSFIHSRPPSLGLVLDIQKQVISTHCLLWATPSFRAGDPLFRLSTSHNPTRMLPFLSLLPAQPQVEVTWPGAPLPQAH